MVLIADYAAYLPELLERVTRIELALSAWEADVLPLNYTRVSLFGACHSSWLAGAAPISRRPDIVPELAGCHRLLRLGVPRLRAAALRRRGRVLFAAALLIDAAKRATEAPA
jgi:hypothetical protein